MMQIVKSSVDRRMTYLVGLLYDTVLILAVVLKLNTTVVVVILAGVFQMVLIITG